tara:strand:+ start:9076 stop:9180 length:105 start_codon:yes stop_codon:yes gene_type:complete
MENPEEEYNLKFSDKVYLGVMAIVVIMIVLTNIW